MASSRMTPAAQHSFVIKPLQVLVLFALHASAFRESAFRESSRGGGLSSTERGACSDILTDGIRNEWKSVVHAHASYDVDEQLSKFDDNYDYDSYVNDHKKASSKETKTGVGVDLKGAAEVFGANSVSGAISASYGLLSGSASASHSSSHGAGGSGKLGFDFSRKNEKMTRDEFTKAKNKIMHQKNALSQSSKSSGLDKNDEEQVSRTVDHKVTEAWSACMKLAEQNIHVKAVPNRNGKTLEFELKYVAGSGPQPAVMPMLTAVLSSPKEGASCEWVDAAGQMNQPLPVTLHQGLVLNVMCSRDPAPQYAEEAINVKVITNMGAFSGEFENVVSSVMADDVREFQSLAMQKIESLQNNEAKLQETLQGVYQRLNKDEETIASQANTISQQAKTITNVNNAAINSNAKVDKTVMQMQHLQQKLQEGVCRLCSVPSVHTEGMFNNKFAGVHRAYEQTGCLQSRTYTNWAGRITHKNNKVGGDDYYTPPIAYDETCDAESLMDPSSDVAVIMDLCCRGDL